MFPVGLSAVATLLPAYSWVLSSRAPAGIPAALSPLAFVPFGALVGRVCPGLVGAGLAGILVSVTVGFLTVWLGVGVGLALGLTLTDEDADAEGLAALVVTALLTGAEEGGASGTGAVSSALPQAVTRASRDSTVKEWKKRFMFRFYGERSFCRGPRSVNPRLNPVLREYLAQRQDAVRRRASERVVRR